METEGKGGGKAPPTHKKKTIQIRLKDGFLAAAVGIYYSFETTLFINTFSFNIRSRPPFTRVSPKIYNANVYLVSLLFLAFHTQQKYSKK